jgi:Fe-S-cluster containining protein
MDIDFTPFFKKYESLVAIADSVFERVKKEYPLCVKCKTECSDCCYALFDLSLIEALYLNHHFHKKFSGSELKELIEKANRADRSVYKLKRNAVKEAQKGKSETEILEQMAQERIRCPLLSDQDMCDLYENRPITCRLYGIPTSIGGQGHTCGISGFEQGKPYPTVNIDTIHKQLYDISLELVRAIRSRHIKMADILVPLSMAILTDYNEEYLGVDDPKDGEQEKDERGE